MHDVFHRGCFLCVIAFDYGKDKRLYFSNPLPELFWKHTAECVFRQVSVIPHCTQRQCHSLALQSGGNVDLSLCLIVRVYLFQKINAKISWIISVPENDFPEPPCFTYPASFICRPIYLSIGLISFKAQLHKQKDLNLLESKVASALPSTCIFLQIGSQTSKTEF